MVLYHFHAKNSKKNFDQSNFWRMLQLSFLFYTYFSESQTVSALLLKGCTNIILYIIWIIIENWHIWNQIRHCSIEILNFISHYLPLVVLNCCIVPHILLSLPQPFSISRVAIIFNNNVAAFPWPWVLKSINWRRLGSKFLMFLYWFF